MQIDWITVAAQIVNFLVLVWLLQRFLYGPITRAMKRREERIEGRLTEAREKREDAEHEAEKLRKKHDELEEQRREILEKARREAKKLREILENDVRKELEQKRREWRESVTEEREEFLRELRLQTARHVHELARSALTDLAGAEIEAQTALRFAERLRELDEDQAARIAGAAQEEGNTILIESRFGLPADAKERIAKAVHDVVSPDIGIDYGRADDLLFGVRLVAGGQTVEWSLARYLGRLEDAVDEKLARVGTAKEREAA